MNQKMTNMPNMRILKGMNSKNLPCCAMGARNAIIQASSNKKQHKDKRRQEMPTKLSKEMVQKLRGPSAEGGVPSPFKNPALEASIDDARQRFPMTWEEKRAQSLAIHKSRMEEMERKAKKLGK